MGVTDAPTVIRHLKSIFPGATKPGGQVHNLVFALSCRTTPTIFLILAGLIFFQRISNEHINCYVPSDEDIRAQAVNQYCFVTGTYTVTSYSPGLIKLGKGLPYPGVGPHVPTGGTEVKYHMYFQWVPFLLFIQAILLSVPTPVWKGLSGDTLSRYCRDVVESSEDQRQAATRFNRNVKIRDHKSYARNRFLIELIIVGVTTLCFYLSDLILAEDFLNLGMKVGSSLNNRHPSIFQQNQTNPLDLVFPKMSKCEFKKFGPGGSIIPYDILCVMTLNVIHEKVFIFQWFWFVLLLLLQAGNLVWRLVFWSTKWARHHPIEKMWDSAYLEGISEDDFKMDVKKLLNKLNYSDWVILVTIGRSVGSKMFTKFLSSLLQLQVSHNKGEDKVLEDESKQMLLGSTTPNLERRDWPARAPPNHYEMDRRPSYLDRGSHTGAGRLSSHHGSTTGIILQSRKQSNLENFREMHPFQMEMGMGRSETGQPYLPPGTAYQRPNNYAMGSSRDPLVMDAPDGIEFQNTRPTNDFFSSGNQDSLL